MVYTEETVLAKLKKLNIPYDYHAHQALFTVEDALNVGIDIGGADTKNLFLKDKDKRKWLFVIPARERANLKVFAEKAGTKHFSFCSPDELTTYLGITPGSVSPLAIINDSKGDVTLVIDEKLMREATVNCHPLRNTATICLKPDDLIRFVAHARHTAMILPLT